MDLTLARACVPVPERYQLDVVVVRFRNACLAHPTFAHTSAAKPAGSARPNMNIPKLFIQPSLRFWCPNSSLAPAQSA
jgi:hypothetical protein